MECHTRSAWGLQETTRTRGWVGWIPRSEAEKNKFQELVLYPGGDRTETCEDESDGLAALQGRLEEAAAAVKAATTASRNRNKFSVPDDIRVMAAEAAKYRDPVRRKLLRKIHGNDGLPVLQERLEEAAAAFKATTKAMRDKNEFTVADKTAEVAKCRDPVRRKLQRK